MHGLNPAPARSENGSWGSDRMTNRLSPSPITLGSSEATLPQRVLVLGARAPVALEWVRSLSATGLKVFCADSLMLPLTRWAAGSSGYFQLPSPRSNVNARGGALQRLVRQTRMEGSIPTCEEAFHLSHEAPRVAGVCRRFVMPYGGRRHRQHK